MEILGGGGLFKMKAVILSAGYGTRLKPLTDNIAKPLVKILGIPVIEYTLNFLNINGIKEVYINRHYFPEQFKHIKIPTGMKITFSTEENILGTLGGLMSFKEYLLDDDFVVVNGDVIFNFDLKQAYHAHKSKKNISTMILRNKERPDVSSVYIDDFSNVVHIGQRDDEIYKNYMFSGFHIIDPSFFSFVKESKIPSCIVRDFYIPYINGGGRINGITPNEGSFFWMEVGNLKGYLNANLNMLSMLSKYKLDHQLESFVSTRWFNNKDKKIVESVEGIWLGDGYYIDHDATILPPVFIGSGSKIMGKCTVGPNVVIGESVLVSEGSQISDSVLLDNTRISTSSLVEKMIVAPSFVFNSNDGPIN